jgi:hypothetical protein
MLTSEFIEFIKDGMIDRVTLYRLGADSAWSIYGYGDSLPAETVNHIVLNEQGSKRLWADLIAAHHFVRKSGYHQIIEING